MANSNMSKDELLTYIAELESENADLQDALDSIAYIVSGPPADEHEDEDDDATDYDDNGN